MKILNTGITLFFLLITPIFSDEESERKALDQEIEEKLKIVSAEGRYDDEDVLILSTSITRDKRDLTASLVRLMDEKYDRNVRGRALSFLRARGELGKPLVVDALLERLSKQLDTYYKEYNELENPEDLLKPAYNVPPEQLLKMSEEELLSLPRQDESIQLLKKSAAQVRTTMSYLAEGKNLKALDTLVNILIEPKGLIMTRFRERDILQFAAENGNASHLEKLKSYRETNQHEDRDLILLLDETLLKIGSRIKEASPD